jgi:hypothetical protein
MNLMRLSSMKAAHAAVAWCRLQEIRVKPAFSLSGIIGTQRALFPKELGWKNPAFRFWGMTRAQKIVYSLV